MSSGIGLQNRLFLARQIMDESMTSADRSDGVTCKLVVAGGANTISLDLTFNDLCDLQRAMRIADAADDGGRQ
jgi:hypothetical protein